jgi:quinol monooxygenase YgiN
MSNLLAMVKLKVQEGSQAEAEAVFEELIKLSHGHDGCLTYAMHKANDDPTTYVLVERWESTDKANAHLNLPGVAELEGKFDGFLAGAPEVLILEPLVFGDPAKGALG